MPQIDKTPLMEGVIGWLLLGHSVIPPTVMMVYSAFGYLSGIGSARDIGDSISYLLRIVGGV